MEEKQNVYRVEMTVRVSVHAHICVQNIAFICVFFFVAFILLNNGMMILLFYDNYFFINKKS